VAGIWTRRTTALLARYFVRSDRPRSLRLTNALRSVGLFSVVLLTITIASPPWEKLSARAMPIWHFVADQRQSSPNLSGLGATQKAWRRAHKPDPSRKLARGCCYLPRVRVEGKPRPTWVAVIFGDRPEKRVLTFTRLFEDGTRESSALASLTTDDLPKDATLVWQKEAGTCKIMQFVSNQFTTELGVVSSGPQVALFSSSDEAPYRSSRVQEAILMSASINDQDVAC
jgi:hypothetical protein